MTRVAALIAAAGTGVAALAIAPPLVALVLLAILAWQCAPGWALASRWYAADGGRGMSWLTGPLWGYALSNLSLLALWLAGLRHPVVVLLAPLPVFAAVRLFAPRDSRLNPPRLDRRDLAAALIVVSFVPAIVGRPFSQVGRVLPEGVAYRAYFTADFIWARTVVVELAKGEQPPRNMFLRGEALNYYWLPHLLSAAEYRWGWSALTPDRILLINGLGLGLVFAAFLYGFVRHFTGSALATAVGCAFALAFVSIEATWFLLRQWNHGPDVQGILSMNVDGITRWVLGTVVVDGLHRLLIYQVTHHAIAYGAALSALALVVVARDAGDTALAWLSGTLIAAALLFSSFSALMITAAVIPYYVGRLVASGRARRIPLVGLVAAVPIAAAVIVSLALHYVDAGGGLIALGLNRLAARNASLAVPLSFGFLLPAGALGLLVGFSRRPARAAALATVAAVCLLFYFYVNVRDHQDVYVAWRAGHVFIIVCGALIAILWERLWESGFLQRAVVVACFAIAALVALPTAVLDLASSQDVYNRRMGPGFRWTVVLSPGEIEGLTWLREHTSRDATVQVEPFVRGRDTWSYVPAFAERRMAAGLPISMVPLAKYERASDRIRELYKSPTASDAFDRAVQERIDYLVVGAPERHGYPTFEPLLNSRPDLFARVFANQDLAVYRLKGSSR